jgi:hypothetical protein
MVRNHVLTARLYYRYTTPAPVIMTTSKIKQFNLHAVRHRVIVALLVIPVAVGCVFHLLSAAALAAEGKGTSVDQEEESGDVLEMAKSHNIYRSRDLIFKPHPQEHGISLEDFSVCRGERTILRESISSMPSTAWLWVGFAYPEATRAKRVHSFEGALTDFISENAKPGSNPFACLI